ncbi:MAG: hypothetical protein Q8M39_11250 [Sulfuricurvum sp.]|nr:hypothetical protein [Sulfuricurvum sp.]
MKGWNTNISWSKRHFGRGFKMTKKIDDNVTLTIEDHTTIIVEGAKYSGTVTVDPATAKALKETGKVKDEPTDA